MNRTTLFQVVRLAGMIAAIAGIIYAVEYMQGSAALWFWVALLGVGFVGLLASFRLARRQTAQQRGGRSPRSKGRRR